MSCLRPDEWVLRRADHAASVAAMKAYRMSADFCLAADNLGAAAELENQLIEAAERLGIFFQFACTDEMKPGELAPGSPLAKALFERPA